MRVTPWFVVVPCLILASPALSEGAWDRDIEQCHKTGGDCEASCIYRARTGIEWDATPVEPNGVWNAVGEVHARATQLWINCRSCSGTENCQTECDREQKSIYEATEALQAVHDHRATKDTGKAWSDQLQSKALVASEKIDAVDAARERTKQCRYWETDECHSKIPALRRCEAMSDEVKKKVACASCSLWECKCANIRSKGSCPSHIQYGRKKYGCGDDIWEDYPIAIPR